MLDHQTFHPFGAAEAVPIAAAQPTRFDRRAGGGVDLRIELGRTQIDPTEAAGLRKGAIMPLGSAAGSLVDVYAGKQRIARGEAVALDGKLAVRIVEVLPQGNRSCECDQ